MPLESNSQTLYLVDISSFIFRAFYAIRSLTNRNGVPTNAVYGVVTMLARLLQEANAEYVAIVYDSKEPSFRKEMYEEYKANRSAPPDELIPQFDLIEQLISTMKLPSFRMSGVEADDLIGTLTGKWLAAGKDHEVIIVSSDKDLMALVEKRVRLWDTLASKVYSPIEVEAKFNVKPEQIRDYLALVGDSSDNIPGVPSIGPKSASDLLKDYGDLEAILNAAKGGKIAGKKGETLKAHEFDARLSARLATLKCDCDVQAVPEKLAYRFHVSQELLDLLKGLDFHTLVNKWTPMLEGERSSANSHSSAGSIGNRNLGSNSADGRQLATPDSFTGATIPRRSPEKSTSQQGQLFASDTPEPAVSLVASPEAFRTVNTEADFKVLLAGIEKAGEFGFDVETTSLNPRLAELVGVAICYDRAFACYIPVGHRGTHQEQLPLARVLEGLRPYLESPRYKKIGQNLKYDWSVMRNLGVAPDGIGADTMVAAYVLEPEGRHNLEMLAMKYLNYSVKTYEQVCGKGKTQIGFDQVPIELATRYSAEDAWVAVHLWDALRPKLEAKGMMQVFSEVDLPLVDILARMEGNGVCIDEEWLRSLSRDFERELKSIEERIEAYTKKPINLNSPKQLGVLLFEELKLPVQGKTKTGYSTDASVLAQLAPLHEIPGLLLEYREISKLKGTYVDPLPELKDPKTGKIHASFHQTVAATGRLSSSNPNLQNIPIKTERGRKIRRAFIPEKGNVLISADYSQIELRLLAHMSGDVELSRSFQKEEDVHRRTASEIFAVPPESVDDRQRGIAKAINFGLMYGKTAFGLAQELSIARREAQDIINRYFERYSGVKRYLDAQIIEAKEKGWTSTLLGRRRGLPDISSRNPMVRANAERMAMNTPIQGTASDLVKLAMIELDGALMRKKLQAKLIIQVHDELVLDCPRGEAKEVEKLVTEVMEGAMKLSVPLRVNSAVGENWMDL